MMTPATSLALNNAGKGTAEKMSLQTTTKNSVWWGRGGADVTWRGISFETYDIWKSSAY